MLLGPRPGPSEGFSYPPPQFPHEAPDRSQGQQPGFTGGLSRRGLLGLVLTLVVLVGAAIGYFDVAPIVQQGDAQTAAVSQFCVDEMRQDYSAAFDLLAPGYIEDNTLDRTQFVQALQVRDQRDGPLQSCTIAGRDVIGTLASTLFFERGFGFTVSATRTAGSQTGNITVIDDHGWKIRYLDAHLHLAG